MRRYVIIGTGVAGLSAGEWIRRGDQSADILLIGDEPYGYYSRPGLAYYLTGELVEEQLYPLSQRDFRRLNLQPLHAQVSQIHPDDHKLRLQDGNQVPYDRLLIATGAQAVRSNIKGADLKGVVKLDNLDDARLILNLTRKASTAVVVGGGITALEMVEGLRSRGLKVHYFLRRDRYWGNVLDETESRIVEQLLKEEGVQLHFHTEMEEILGKRDCVCGVSTKDGRQIKCDLVAVAIGIRPRKTLAERAGLKVERGILVNQYLQTSHPDIFAAGDVAQVYDPVSGKSVLDSLWGLAREQGRIAGLNLSGQETPYLKTMAFNVTRLAGLTTTIIGTVGRGEDPDLLGIARGDSETWRQLPDAISAQDDFEVNRLRILVGKHRLLGALVMGDQTLSQPLLDLVKQQVNISSIRRELLQPDAPLADIIADFWRDWKFARGKPNPPLTLEKEKTLQNLGY